MINYNNPTITINYYDDEFDLVLLTEHYANGRLALDLRDAQTGEPFTKVTVNLPDQHLNPGEVFVKDWAENEAIIPALVEAGWLKPTGREVQSGYVFPKVMTMEGPLTDTFGEDQGPF